MGGQLIRGSFIATRRIDFALNQEEISSELYEG
jgi:hypothetical protein